MTADDLFMMYEREDTKEKGGGGLEKEGGKKRKGNQRKRSDGKERGKDAK